MRVIHGCQHRRWIAVALVWTAISLLPPARASARNRPDPATKLCSPDVGSFRQLVLKDGSYQLVRSCEVRARVVSFVSAERNDQEELPTSLIDWNASKVVSSEQSESKSTNAAGVAVGATTGEQDLPADGTVFLVEEDRGRRNAQEVVPSRAIVKRQKSRFAAETLWLGRARQFLVLHGPSAHVRTHSDLPSVFVRVDDMPVLMSKVPAQPREYRLVRLQPWGNGRIVATHERWLLKVNNQPAVIVPANEEQVGTEWIKLRPVQQLAPGEYAVIESVGQTVGLDVWDFTVMEQQ